jgi:hypothetical protein
MKKIVFLLLVLFYTISFASTGEDKEESNLIESVEIIVLDAETEEPLPAAHIKISEINLEAYTDFEGFAKFSLVKKGFYDLDVSFISYKKVHLEDFLIDNANHQIIIKLYQ